MVSPVATLNSGYTIPLIGLGTWQSKPGEVKAAVVAAVNAGYRHIDCAEKYGNEKEVGEAFAEIFAAGIVKREDLFVTSKLWNAHHDEVEKMLLKSLTDLGLRYLDLYLVHWPVNTVKEEPRMKPLPASSPQPSLTDVWSAMIDVQQKKLVRSIGVSNYSISKLKQLEGMAVRPAVNQVELHPLCRQDKLLAYCSSVGIHCTAFSPLGTPGSEWLLGPNVKAVLESDVVKTVAAKTKRSPAQVVLRWGIQRGTSVIPKSISAERIASNFQMCDSPLSEEDMQQLNAIEPQVRMNPGRSWVMAEGWYPSHQSLFDDDDPTMLPLPP